MAWSPRKHAGLGTHRRRPSGAGSCPDDPTAVSSKEERTRAPAASSCSRWISSAMYGAILPGVAVQGAGKCSASEESCITHGHHNRAYNGEFASSGELALFSTAIALPRRRVMAEPIPATEVRAVLRTLPRPYTTFSIWTFGSIRSAIGSMGVKSGSPRLWSAPDGSLTTDRRASRSRPSRWACP